MDFDPSLDFSKVGDNDFDPSLDFSEVSDNDFDPSLDFSKVGDNDFDPSLDFSENEGELAQNEHGKELEPNQADDPNESNTEVSSEQFDPNESSENSNESDQYEMGGDDESNYDSYEYGDNFEQEGNSAGFYENFNAESMNTVLLSENLIYAYLKEYMELMAENEAEAAVQGEQADVDNSKEEISELEQFLNEERERIRLEQQQAGLDEMIEPELELVAKEEEIEQEQEEEVGNQENISEEMVPNNEEEVENQEMKLEEELQSTLPNESIESSKVEEIEENNEEPQPHGIEEKIEERENYLKEDDEKNEKCEQHQSKNQIEEGHDIESELIAHENELDLIKEEHGEKEEHEEVTKEGELSQISKEFEVIHEINSNETEVLITGQEEDLEQDYFSPYREKQNEIEEYKDPQQELEEILEQTREMEQEALIEEEEEQEQEKSDKNIKENYEKAKKSYNQETGKRPIYANNETEGFKQWLEQKKEPEEKQEHLHLQIQEDNSEMVKKEIEQESDQGINPKLQPLLKEIIENFKFLENLTAKFKELYGSALNNQISKTEKKELKLLINLLKKVGPAKLMFFTSIQAIKRYAIKEKFSHKAQLNQTLNHFITKILQNNLGFKNFKELISPIESELFEKFMQYTHKTKLIKDLVNEFNKHGNWIKNLSPTQTFINFINKKRKLLENNPQYNSSNTMKKQIKILSNYISLISKIKENDSLTKAIKNLILRNKQKFNATDIEKWLLITNNAARNQLKKIFTKEEYQTYVRTQKHVSIKTIEEIARKKGGKCHTKEIKNAKSRLHLECAEEHHFYPTYDSVVYQNTWCPHCHIYTSEEICRQFFEKIFKKPFPTTRPPWLVNKRGNQMELDGHCEELRLAWEKQGEQHRRKAFGLSDEEIRKIQEDDADKLQKCTEHGELLLHIPDTEIVPWDDMQNYIIELYEKLSGKSLGNVPEYDWREFTIHENKHAKKFRKYIEEKGGTLLTPYFTARKEVTIMCEHGHEWTTTPNSVYRGNWCSVCAGNVKGTTEEFREIGERFQCDLQNEYTNAKTPLRYKCQKKHEFSKDPYWLKKKSSKIKVLCPECKKEGYAQKFEKFVRSKGGKILTPYKGRFKPIKIKCENEHEWNTTPAIVYQGHWCKTCAIENDPNKKRKEAAEQEFLKMLQRLKYTPLSNYENNTKQVQLKCNNKHTFPITPKYFKRLVHQKIVPCKKCRKKEV